VCTRRLPLRSLAPRAVGPFASFDVGAVAAVWHLALLGSLRRWAVCAVWQSAPCGSSRLFAHPRAPFPRSAPFVHCAVSRTRARRFRRSRRYRGRSTSAMCDASLTEVRTSELVVVYAVEIRDDENRLALFCACWYSGARRETAARTFRAAVFLLSRFSFAPASVSRRTRPHPSFRDRPVPEVISLSIVVTAPSARRRLGTRARRHRRSGEWP